MNCKEEEEERKTEKKPEGESEPQFIISTLSSHTELCLYNYPQRYNLFISNFIYLLLTLFLSFVFIKIFIV